MRREGDDCSEREKTAEEKEEEEERTEGRKGGKNEALSEILPAKKAAKSQSLASRRTKGAEEYIVRK